MHEQDEKFNKEREITMNQTEILELKDAMNKMKKMQWRALKKA